MNGAPPSTGFPSCCKFELTINKLSIITQYTEIKLVGQPK